MTWPLFSRVKKAHPPVAQSYKQRYIFLSWLNFCILIAKGRAVIDIFLLHTSCLPCWYSQTYSICCLLPHNPHSFISHIFFPISTRAIMRYDWTGFSWVNSTALKVWGEDNIHSPFRVSVTPTELLPRATHSHTYIHTQQSSRHSPSLSFSCLLSFILRVFV